MNAPRLRACAAAIALAAGFALAGCASESSPRAADQPPAIARGPAPAYDEVARVYNQNADRLARFRAQVQLQVTFNKPDGQRQYEECDGLLQVIRPGRMALSFRKVSQTLFWLGSNDTHYWWIDLTGDRPLAAIGLHDRFGPRQAGLIGLAIQPLDLLRLVGCVPLPTAPDRPLGATQWSADGQLLGVTTVIGAGPRPGRQRLWLDPQTYLPRMVELFDEASRVVMVAELSAPDSVRQFAEGGLSPQLATKIDIRQMAADTRLVIFLSGMQDGTARSERPISPDAFDFEKLKTAFSISQVADLDQPPPQDAQRAPR